MRAFRRAAGGDPGVDAAAGGDTRIDAAAGGDTGVERAADSPAHWLDRLAVRINRRQALKAAAASALALPLLGASAAEADDPTACRKGCMVTSHAVFDNETAPCFVRANGKMDAAIILAPLTFGLTISSIISAPVKSFMNCVDTATLEPNCPGFNPTGPLGPCETCKGNCCPDQNTETGYYCCTIVPFRSKCWCTQGG
jgi:hypothetical protein